MSESEAAADGVVAVEPPKEFEPGFAFARPSLSSLSVSRSMVALKLSAAALSAPEPSTSTYRLSGKPVLRRPVESRLRPVVGVHHSPVQAAAGPLGCGECVGDRVGALWSAVAQPAKQRGQPVSARWSPRPDLGGRRAARRWRASGRSRTGRCPDLAEPLDAVAALGWPATSRQRFTSASPRRNTGRPSVLTPRSSATDLIVAPGRGPVQRDCIRQRRQAAGDWAPARAVRRQAPGISGPPGS